MSQNFLNFLRSEYDRRLTRNSKYSQRAFARDLGISKSLLHDVFHEKKSMSFKTMKSVASQLGLKDTELSTIVDDSRSSMSQQEFSQISNWYYYAILSLAKIPNTPADPSIIARRLGLQESEVVEALQTLEKMNLIDTQNGRLVRQSSSLSADWKVPSIYLKHFHSQNLSRAERAMFNAPFEAREINSLTVALSKNQYLKIKKQLSSFQKKIMKTLDESSEAEHVYTFAFQLFPQTDKGFYEET